MRKLNRISLILFILVSIAGSLAAQTPDTKRTAARISDYLNNLEAVGFTGSVLVELNGKKAISRGYGFRNVAKKQKNTPDTIFDIGSITKQFTAAAILKLEMQGKVSTDDKITKYFRNVPPDKSNITIHDLLRHSAGLPSVVGGDFDKITESEFVEKVMSTPLRFESGTRFGYSNVGYSLLALIIEKVSGRKYEQFLYENLWRPAGMEMTGYSRPSFNKDLIATGYKEDAEWGKPNEKGWAGDAPYLHLTGNGGILSTTGDMYGWHLALLSEKILSKAAKEKLYHPKLRPGENENPYYAYGWDILKTPRNTIVTRHNGTNRVFYADFHRFIDEGITIIFLSNRAHLDFLRTNRFISRIVFDPSFVPTIPTADTEANRKFTDEVIAVTLEKGFDAGLDARTKRVKGLDVIEPRLNDKGYELLEANKTNEAISVFRIATAAFPRSSNAFDSLCEAYMGAGSTKLAIENCQKAIALDPENRNALEMLEKLRKR